MQKIGFLCFIFLFSLHVKADTYVVGSCVIGAGGTYTTIQAAVNAASNSDTSNPDIVSICDGTYNESILTQNNANALTIKSVTGQNSVKIISNSYGIRTQNSTNLTIENIEIESQDNSIDFQNNAGAFKIKNTKLKSNDAIAIYARGSGNEFEIDGVDIISSGDEGIWIENGNNGIIKNSCIKNTGSDGLRGKGTNSLEATNNCFSSIPTGKYEVILSDGSNNPNFYGNYWERYSASGVSDNSRLGFCSNSCNSVSSPLPKVEYRFDECRWNGTVDEVKDNIANYHGRAYVANTSSDALINRTGDFSEDSNKDYVSLDYFSMNGLDSFSIGVWVKTSDTGSQQEILQALGSSASDDEFELYLYGDNKIRINIKDHGENFYLSQNKITNGYWHQIFVTRTTDTVCLYIDGIKEECKNGFEIGLLSTHENSLIVGQEQDSYGGSFSSSQNFVGFIDELKIFDTTLQENQIKEIYDNELSGKNYDGTSRASIFCPTTPAYVEYKFNECSWNGTSGEVKDSSGKNLNATAIQTDTIDEGKLCRAGDFTATGIDDYVVLPKEIIDGFSDFTFSVWVNTTVNKSEQNIIQGLGNTASDDEFQLYIKNNDTLKLSILDEQHTCDIGFSITDGNWHHIAISRLGGTVKYYVDGLPRDDSDSYPQGALSIHDNTLIVGQEQDSFGGNFNSAQALEGKLDEMKFFKTALSSDEIKKIYNYENSGHNYDGSSSQCVVYDGYLTPLEFEGAEITLNTTTNAPHWTHVDFNQTFASIPIVFVLPEKTGSHPASVRLKNITNSGFDAVFAEPQSEDGPHLAQNINFLAINKGIHKIGNTYFEVGAIDTKKTQQKNILNEWEKIDTTLDICSPAVVGQIQSLNNETGLDSLNNGTIIRSKPWITTAIDVNSSGIYTALERSETNEGNITKNETIGYMIAQANIQDSVIDDDNNNIKFETIVKKDYFVGWDDSCKSVDFVNTYSKTPLVAANKNSKNGQDGGWFRRCQLDNTKIGLQIDEDRFSDSERNHILETGAIYVFSGTIVIHEDAILASLFDAWDTYKDINSD